MVFTWLSNQDEKMHLALYLRKEVFVDEQGFSLEDELDEQDKTALHVIGQNEMGETICVARIFLQEEGVYHAGRIAVKQDVRGKGIGAMLMQELFRKAKELGACAIELGAQHDKAVFYERVGFVRFGEPFLDAGYPHISMRKNLL